MRMPHRPQERSRYHLRDRHRQQAEREACAAGRASGAGGHASRAEAPRHPARGSRRRRHHPPALGPRRRPRLPDAAPAGALEHGRRHRTAAGLRAEGKTSRRSREAPLAARVEPRARYARRLSRRRRPLASRAAARVSFTTSDGRKLTYRKLGHGPVLVCHPGGPGFSAVYFGDLAALWEQYTLVLLNPRGTGGSDRPRDRRAYQVDDYVADLEELRAHLGQERMLLLGHSHGGVVAQAYAASYPGRVRRLVLASTLARFGPGQQAAMRK